MPFRKVSRCHQDFIEIIYKVADKLNLRDIEYITEFGYEEIDGFVGGIYKVLIKGLKDGQKVKQCAIIKFHPDINMRNYLRQRYQREFVFYEYVVPELIQVQRNFKIIEGLKIKFPNCIYASAEYEKETIVVSSLLEEGFRMLDRFHKTDLAHATLVMKNLAKLHGLSFVLENSNPSRFSEVKKMYSVDVQYSDPEHISKSMKSYYNASVNVVSDPVAKKMLKDIAPSIFLVLNKCSMPVSHSVICHADCWTNNILFKYQGRRPVDMVFMDYQLSRYASPATDISYFFYMSTEKDFLSDHYEHLLNIYYGSLTAVLRHCGLDVKEVYPQSVFQKHLKEYSVLGLIEALVSLKIITAAADEAFHMTEKLYDSSEDIFMEDLSQNQSLYVERVNGVVNDFFARGYSLTNVLNK